MIAWLWHQVVLPSWLSLLSAPIIVVAYVLLGRRQRIGWWFTIAAQSFLIVIAFTNHQYGLLAALLPMAQAVRNWWSWRRPDPAADPATIRTALWANDLRRLPPPPDAIEGVGWLGEVDCRAAAELACAMEVEQALVAERFQQGARGFVARACDGSIAAWLWVSTGRVWAAPIGRWKQFADDECYGWEAGTLPEHRGRGLFTALLLASGRVMAAEGARFQWGGIHDHNLASQRANAAAGFRPVLHVHVHAHGALRTSPAEYADPRLVARARALLGEITGDART
jgi:hypothetical protein